ncbi:MarR family winged helix-turn-helix transcriptional regulator [Clostridium estertheticum]|uniref:MarR family winged helix-turn-helix transcriptional regulator n=1 Tax=Clostridium estertheticum TaxID=238834 RepID=UPI001C7D2DC5|nr:MarR family transcriptional regulator [Clostridium estertheticum]MBX4263294.1 MarR family transcriptional regulator [Clostridium estertheticum]MBX4270715.1 MarR family transcriptional regulator [Clostridium estertheticum]WLC78564.1 MarR family transcriptional regulator [Clostridium estertheticum]WLC89589.1 MarR family transcriptional regulator [Clostridium estertheticum]
MNKELHYILRLCHTLCNKKILLQTSTLGLSPGQPKILEFLEYHNGCEQKEIAKACEIEPATVTNLLARMEKTHLIERKQLNGNRRSLHVSLTNEGEIVTKQVLKIFEEVRKKAFEGFTVEQQEVTLRLLTKMFDNLSD